MLLRTNTVLTLKTLLWQNLRYKHRLLLSKMFPNSDVVNRFSKPVETEAGSLRGSSSLSHKLMLQHKQILGASSGSFYFLPSMTRALEKLYRVIDQEMQSIGAQKITMPCLASKQLWNASGRWDKIGSELFTLNDRTKASYCLAPTHEEAVTSIVASECPISYKRLPIRLYQIGRKFRDEARPKHGLLRCREFEMKDLYSFDASSEGAEESFRETCSAYSRIFSRLGLSYVEVDASTGVMGGLRSREFHLLSPVGEDSLFICDSCGTGVNEELLLEKGQQGKECIVPGCHGSLEHKSGIEIAHAFILGTTYSDTFKATFVDKEGNKKNLLEMGCYGIGVTRLLSASIEALSTPDQLRWCRLLAPHQVCIIPQKEGYKSEVTRDLADQIYDRLESIPNLQSEVVIDDRLHLSIGQRVHLASAAGFPFIIALGKQALSDPALCEFQDVYNSATQFCSIQQLVDILEKVETVIV